jgi:hypothetical protein
MANIPLPVNRGKVRLNYADLGTNTRCSDNISLSAKLNKALRPAALAAILMGCTLLYLYGHSS